MEEYYQKVIQLQDKLRKSEEERLNLEIKFNEMLQSLKDEEEAHFKKLRSKYKKFQEEDRRRQQRNDKILEALDRIENRTALWEAKTEQFREFRKTYQQYLRHHERSPNAFVNPLLEKYVRGLSPEDTDQNFTINDSGKYSKLGNINTMYQKTSNAPNSRDLNRLKTTKDAENALKQNENVHGNLETEDSPHVVHRKLEQLLAENYKSDPLHTIPNQPEYKSAEIVRQTLKKINLPPSTAEGCATTEFRQTPVDYANISLVKDEYVTLKPRDQVSVVRPSQPTYPRSGKAETTAEGRAIAEFRQTLVDGANISLAKDDDVTLKPHDQVSVVRPSQPTYPRSDKVETTAEGRAITEFRQTRVDDANISLAKDDGARLKPHPRDQVSVVRPSQPTYPRSEKVEITDQLQPNLEVKTALAEELPGTDKLVRQDSNHGKLDDVVEQSIAQPSHQQELENVEPINYDGGNELSQLQYYEDEPAGYQDQHHSYDLAEQAQQPAEYHDDNSQVMSYGQNAQVPYEESGTHSEQYDQIAPMEYDVQYDENTYPQFEYDQNGQPISQYSYDENGQPLAQTFQTYDTEQLQYDENGQPIYQYDENGQVLQYEMQYDENGQPIYQYDDQGQVLEQYYDENGQPVQYQNYNEELYYGQDNHLDQKLPQTDLQDLPQSDETKIEKQEVEASSEPVQLSSGIDEKQPQIDVADAVPQVTASKILDVLDTDSESIQHDAKISNDSDFDFSNG